MSLPDKCYSMHVQISQTTQRKGSTKRLVIFILGQWPKTGIPGQWPKTGIYLVRLGPKTGTFKNQVKSAPYHTSPAIGPKRIVPVLGRIKPRYTRGFLLRLTSSCFCHFFSRSPPCECRRTGSPPPPSTSHTPHHTSNTCICLHTACLLYTSPSPRDRG